MFEALLSATRRFGPKPCLGTRQQLPNGSWGAYSWLSYDSLYRRVLSVGSALLRLGLRAGEGVGLLCDNSAEWVVVEQATRSDHSPPAVCSQACHAYGFVSVPLWYTVGTHYVEKLIHDSSVAVVLCGRRWTCALLRMVREGRGALRLLVQCEHLRYEELALKESLPPSCPLKLVDLNFVERMGECHRLPPQPSPLTAAATVVYRWRLDAEPVGCRLSQANLVASLCALRLAAAGVVGNDDTYLSYVPLAHIFERSMLLLCLVSGAKIGFYHGQTQKLFDDVVGSTPLSHPPLACPFPLSAIPCLTPNTTNLLLSCSILIPLPIPNPRELKPTLMVGLPGAFRQLYRKYCAVQEQWSPLYKKLFLWAWRRKRTALLQYHPSHHPSRSGLLNMLFAFLVPQIDTFLGGRLRYVIVCDRDMPSHVTLTVTVLSAFGFPEAGGLVSMQSPCLTPPEGGGYEEGDVVPHLVGFPLPCAELKLVRVNLGTNTPNDTVSAADDTTASESELSERPPLSISRRLPSRKPRGRGEREKESEGEAKGEGEEQPLGELYLRGANSFEGYHGKENLTKLAYDSDRWLKTGYICRIPSFSIALLAHTFADFTPCLSLFTHISGSRLLIHTFADFTHFLSLLNHLAISHPPIHTFAGFTPFLWSPHGELQVLGKRNQFLEPALGRFVSAQRLETIYAHRCPLVHQIWCHCKPCAPLVAVVALDQEVLFRWHQVETVLLLRLCDGCCH
ncbi:MAG: hypothetical protein SGPRY_004683 [Prymnesium sp.]